MEDCHVGTRLASQEKRRSGVQIPLLVTFFWFSWHRLTFSVTWQGQQTDKRKEPMVWIEHTIFALSGTRAMPYHLATEACKVGWTVETYMTYAPRAQRLTCDKRAWKLKPHLRLFCKFCSTEHSFDASINSKSLDTV